MVDMLVRLYDLPDPTSTYESLTEKEIILRRPAVYEKHLVESFVQTHFSPKWVSEVSVAMTKLPVTCYIATRQRQILGFGCYDTTAKGYFGPTGVAPGARGLGLGKAILYRCMEALRADGYAYGIIGGVGPAAFYQKAIGAQVIAGSENSIYRDILPEPH